MMSVETITQEQTTTNFNPSISNNKTTNMFSFRISDDFLASYKTKTPPFGYKDAGGNSVGEITFLRTYSRLKEDGTKETTVCLTLSGHHLEEDFGLWARRLLMYRETQLHYKTVRLFQPQK